MTRFHQIPSEARDVQIDHIPGGADRDPRQELGGQFTNASEIVVQHSFAPFDIPKDADGEAKCLNPTLPEKFA